MKSSQGPRLPRKRASRSSSSRPGSLLSSSLPSLPRRIRLRFNCRFKCRFKLLPDRMKSSLEPRCPLPRASRSSSSRPGSPLSSSLPSLTRRICLLLHCRFKSRTVSFRRSPSLPSPSFPRCRSKNIVSPLLTQQTSFQKSAILENPRLAASSFLFQSFSSTGPVYTTRTSSPIISPSLPPNSRIIYYCISSNLTTSTSHEILSSVIP